MEEKKDRYLTIVTVAELLSCTEQHIYNLIREGSLSAIKVGSRAVRVSEWSLLEFVEMNKINPDDFYDPDKEKPREPKEQGTVVAKSRWMEKP